MEYKYNPYMHIHNRVEGFFQARETGNTQVENESLQNIKAILGKNFQEQLQILEKKFEKGDEEIKKSWFKQARTNSEIKNWEQLMECIGKAQQQLTEHISNYNQDVKDLIIDGAKQK
jgi:hypothetical protein